MIQVVRTGIPKVLQDNQQQWTNELIALVNNYGGYDKIPENLKSSTVNKYRHTDIQSAVIAMTKGKCVFCESVIETVDYTNIEHFYPKSLHPKYTFKWSNLFPACRKCNIPKNNIDTKVTQLIHPSIDNGEDYFEFKDLRIGIKSTAPDKVKASNTIEHCNLDRISLSRSYGELLITIYEVENNLKDTINHYNTLVQKAAKIRVALNILEAIDNLKAQSSYFKPYAGFVRHFVKNSVIINDSLNIINDTLPLSV